MEPVSRVLGSNEWVQYSNNQFILETTSGFKFQIICNLEEYASLGLTVSASSPIMLFGKQNDEESSHFKAANTQFSGDSSLFCLIFQCHIVICHHSTITLEHMQRIRGWQHQEECFLWCFIPHELADKENACAGEWWETFHRSWTNTQLLLCDTCEIYAWIFENRVSKNKDSFHYLAIKGNKIRLKAFINFSTSDNAI